MIKKIVLLMYSCTFSLMYGMQKPALCEKSDNSNKNIIISPDKAINLFQEKLLKQNIHTSYQDAHALITLMTPQQEEIFIPFIDNLVNFIVTQESREFLDVVETLEHTMTVLNDISEDVADMVEIPLAEFEYLQSLVLIADTIIFDKVFIPTLQERFNLEPHFIELLLEQIGTNYTNIINKTIIKNIKKMLKTKKVVPNK